MQKSKDAVSFVKKQEVLGNNPINGFSSEFPSGVDLGEPARGNPKVNPDSESLFFEDFEGKP